MATSEVIDLLSTVPLFSSCSKRDLTSIANSSKEVSHEAGDVLAREGDPGLGFFLILTGTAKVTVNGRTRAKLGAGDFYGEISLIDEGPRSATVTAETPMRLLGMTAWSFRELIAQNPAIAPKLLRVLAARLRAASARITD